MYYKGPDISAPMGQCTIGIALGTAGNFCVSAHYEILADGSEDYVFVPPNLYDVTAP